MAELNYRVLEDGRGGWIKSTDSGDGTVIRASAAGTAEPMYVAQTHGALPKTSDVLTNVCAILTETSPGAKLAGPQPALELPDIITAGDTEDVIIGIQPGAARVGWDVTDVATRRRVPVPGLVLRDGRYVGRLHVREPGLYRIRVKAGGGSSVSELVLAMPPDGADDG